MLKDPGNQMVSEIYDKYCRFMGMKEIAYIYTVVNFCFTVKKSWMYIYWEEDAEWRELDFY